ncbi:ATP-dependent DNA helicase [Auricularia subglabra TFB-10046 SS5]|nr:ATP-dependent DNA helicase [Auricularia subglabra TFB-10046 SS5]
MDEALEVLRESFGLAAFRGKQAEVIERIVVQDKNALAVMPTGSGKSLCYQLPSLMLPGLTLVISPLIALMKDQVDALKRKGIDAGRFDSAQSQEEYHDTVGSLRDGSLKLLYVAPERLNMEGFMALIGGFTIELLAVDESHCVSEWGDAFRPDYLKIARFVEENHVNRVLCLTATATPEVALDIARAFKIDEEHGIFRTPSYRPKYALFLSQDAVTNIPSLQLEIDSIPTDPEGVIRIGKAAALIKGHPGPTIIYVTSQKNTENVANALCSMGIPARFYHAGMETGARKTTQEWFMSSPTAVVCATIAFGMAGYSQEVGRAGRDGKPSKCTLFLHTGDRCVLENFARGNTPSKDSVRAMVKHTCIEAIGQGTKRHDVLEINAYKLSRDVDIREVTLGLLYAQLELRFGFIRAITPLYAVYQYSAKHPGYENARADTSRAAKAIFAHATLAKTWHTIDVTEAAASYKLQRNEIVGRLNEWADAGWIVLKPSQRRNRYHLLKELPKDDAGINEVADAMFAEMLKREEAEVARMDRVFAWAAAPKCLPAHLAEYFGDAALPACGQCTVCRAGGQPATTYAYAPPPFDEGLFKAVLAAVPVRDDARFLTRVAFGITSPRITAEKLSSDSAFGTMAEFRWEEILARCEKEVAKWKKANPNGPPAPPSPAPQAPKRKYTGGGGRGGGSAGASRGRGASSSSGYRGGYNGSRGGSSNGAKRARGSWGSRR